MKSRFDWDRGNLEKCQKHRVAIDEIESLFHGDVTVFDDHTHSLSEQRLKGIGKTSSGRSLLVVFTTRVREGNRLIRPLSARFMHAKEIEFYAKQKT